MRFFHLYFHTVFNFVCQFISIAHSWLANFDEIFGFFLAVFLHTKWFDWIQHKTERLTEAIYAVFSKKKSEIWNQMQNLPLLDPFRTFYEVINAMELLLMLNFQRVSSKFWLRLKENSTKKISRLQTNTYQTQLTLNKRRKVNETNMTLFWLQSIFISSYKNYTCAIRAKKFKAAGKRVRKKKRVTVRKRQQNKIDIQITLFRSHAFILVNEAVGARSPIVFERWTEAGILDMLMFFWINQRPMLATKTIKNICM